MLIEFSGVYLMLLGHQRVLVQKGLCLFVSVTCCLQTLSSCIQRNFSLSRDKLGEGEAIRLIANVVLLLAPSKAKPLLFLTDILIPNFILKCVDSNNTKLVFKKVSKPSSLQTL